MKADEIINPAWDIWCRMYGPDPKKWNGNIFDRDYATGEKIGRYADVDGGSDAATDRLLSDHRVRNHIIDHMTFAIPPPSALDRIAALGPIVEMGAGTGYWAWLLRQMGVDVIAYDAFPPQTHPLPDEGAPNGRQRRHNGWFRGWWTEVERGYPSVVAKHPDRALLMVWPYMNSMADRTIRAYTGEHVAYVGEGAYGACANEAFFSHVERYWTVKEYPIPQFSGIHDELWILKRKEKR